MTRVFRRNSFTSGRTWFPFPIILPSHLQNIKQRMQIFGYPEVDSSKSSASLTLEEKLNDIVLATKVTEPWAMLTWQVQHFFGYHEEPVYVHEHLSWYDEALENAVKSLTPRRMHEYAQCRPHEMLAKPDFTVNREIVSFDFCSHRLDGL